MSVARRIRFALRRGTAAQWAAAGDPILLDGEPGVLVDPSGPETLKIGDGVTAFSALQGSSGSGGGGAVSSVAGKTGAVVLVAADVSDASTTGRALLTAPDAAAARSAIGAGTSSLALGATGTTAAAGDHTHTAASETVVGPVELATAAETTAGTDNTRAVHPAGLKVELDKKAAFSHQHWADDVFRGGGAPLDTDVLGNGTADATKYLAGDSTWKTMPAGGGGSTVARQVRTLVGRYYNGVDHVMTTNRAIPRSLACFPISFAETVTVDRIGMTITTAGSAGNFARLGIYASGADGLPTGTPVIDAGTIDTTTAGVKELTVSQVLTAGVVYWLCYTGTSAAGSGYGDASTATQNSANMRLGRTSMAGTAVSATMVYRSGNSDGVLPDATGSTWTFATDYARPFVRVGAVA